jgi:hypothetical protein
MPLKSFKSPSIYAWLMKKVVCRSTAVGNEKRMRRVQLNKSSHSVHFIQKCCLYLYIC